MYLIWFALISAAMITGKTLFSCFLFIYRHEYLYRIIVLKLYLASLLRGLLSSLSSHGQKFTYAALIFL